jgi:DNA-binding NtrC family response regulator
MSHRILVADDNAASRELIREVLEMSGYDVVEAADGRDAVSRAREHAPDLVLVDIQMPRLDGYGVLRELRADPRLLRICTWWRSRLSPCKATATARWMPAFDGYITKPVEIAALRQEIKRFSVGPLCPLRPAHQAARHRRRSPKPGAGFGSAFDDNGLQSSPPTIRSAAGTGAPRAPGNRAERYRDAQDERHGVVEPDSGSGSRHRRGPDDRPLFHRRRGGSHQEGRCDYLTKPISLPVLRERIGKLATDARRRQRVSQLDGELMDTSQFEGMVGRSPLMWEMFAQIRRVAPHYRACAVTGPTGTGKELVAQALHKLSQASGPMVVCNCSAVVETLFESELFGHVKGAFTGADSNKMGLFEYAHGGTLFLDEIGDMPLSTQAKLLRVLQNREVQRVGSLTARQVDVRVVAATNHDLRAQIAEKRFREDLYYRLSMVEIKTPALADRKEDLPLLERFFIQKYAAQYKKPVESMTPARADSAGAPRLARQCARVGKCDRARVHAGGRRGHRHSRSSAVHAPGRPRRVASATPARPPNPPARTGNCRSTNRSAA